MTTEEPKPRRRWLQYSLRTMLIVVTVFCIWMGIATKRARDQRLAVEAILEVGGSVMYEHQRQYQHKINSAMLSGTSRPALQGPDPPGPDWLRRLIGDEYFFSVANVRLDRRQVNDSILAAVGRLTNLILVSLSETKIDDSSMVHLKSLTNLYAINLINTKVTDAGLVHLKGLPKLKILELINTQVTDAGLEHLKGMANLQHLSLVGTQITDDGLKHLKELTNLRILQLGSTQVTDKGIKKLQQALPNCSITPRPHDDYPPQMPFLIRNVPIWQPQIHP